MTIAGSEIGIEVIHFLATYVQSGEQLDQENAVCETWLARNGLELKLLSLRPCGFGSISETGSTWIPISQLRNWVAMDPASIVALIEGSLGLALQCGGVAKTLSDIAARYRASELSIMSMAQSLDTMQMAWSRIKEWSQAQWFSLQMDVGDDPFALRLTRSLEIGKLVMDALQEDLRLYQSDTATLSFKQRSKMVWNQDALKTHQDRIRDQATSMTLLLQAIQL